MPLVTPPTTSAPMYARNKLTGQTFLVGPTTQMIDDLGDVDTSTTGPEDGQALIWDDSVAQWVPGPAGVPISTDADNAIGLGVDGGIYSNEVHLGTTGPTVEGPNLWANAEEGVIYAAATGPTGTEWVPVGGSEVEVTDVEPTTNARWELWADIGDSSPTDPLVLGMGMNDLTDADTASTPPIPGNVLAWSGTQWMPGIASSVDALDDLFDVDTSTVAPVDGDTLVYDAASLTWVPGAGGVRSYRETIAVAAFPATLTVAHGLNVATVSTTVVAAGPPRTQVTAEVELTDANTATVTLTTGAVGDYEVLVLG